MLTRIIVNGAHGKMGTLACTTLAAHPNFALVGQLGKKDNLAEAIKDTKAEIVLELTRADCVYENSQTILMAGARPVIGASGLTNEQIQQLTHIAERQRLGGIIVPNFSIAAVLMMQFAAKAAAYLSEVEIIEMHHQHKLDAPSGTALKTAELIAAARTAAKNKLELKELVHGARGGLHHDVSVHSVRVPGVLARQDVIFGGVGETLTISHNSIDRQSFMPGVVLACQQVLALDGLVYGLEYVLDQ